jgi:hypothetical protein
MSIHTPFKGVRDFAHELKDNLVTRGIYRKYIFGYIANVPRVWARSSAPETEGVVRMQDARDIAT